MVFNATLFKVQQDVRLTRRPLTFDETVFLLASRGALMKENSVKTGLHLKKQLTLHTTKT